MLKPDHHQQATFVINFINLITILICRNKIYPNVVVRLHYTTPHFHKIQTSPLPPQVIFIKTYQIHKRMTRTVIFLDATISAHTMP